MICCLDCGNTDIRCNEKGEGCHCNNCGSSNFGSTKDFRFEKGDRVFHKNLKIEGTFIEYDWTGVDECWVDFDNEGGFEDARHISTNQIVLVERKGEKYGKRSN